MCIVIDTCTIAPVFNPKDINHDDFSPVLQWISTGRGRMVFGGTKYKDELKKLSGYLRYIKELEKAGKCIIIDDNIVDNIQKDIENKFNHRDFNDTHIVAIIIASQVRIICTKEKRAIPWFKKKEIYPSGIKKPKIYSSKNNISLLKSKKNISKICLK